METPYYFKVFCQKIMKEQYLRIERWLGRLKEAYNKDEFIEDYIYTFFQNCFHLKNWIIKSKALDSEAVNEFINSNTDMKICRDICNGSKHLINNKPSFDEGIHKNINERKYKIIKTTNEKRTYCFIHGKNHLTLDALDLAENCFELWKGFLQKNKLL